MAKMISAGLWMVAVNSWRLLNAADSGRDGGSREENFRAGEEWHAMRHYT